MLNSGPDKPDGWLDIRLQKKYMCLFDITNILTVLIGCKFKLGLTKVFWNNQHTNRNPGSLPQCFLKMEGGGMAHWLVFLLPNPAAPGSNPGILEKFLE